MQAYLLEVNSSVGEKVHWNTKAACRITRFQDREFKERRKWLMKNRVSNTFYRCDYDLGEAGCSFLPTIIFRKI